MFFVVDEEHKNTVVTSPTQVFVPNEQILVPMNGTFSFSMEVTYEKTGYVPDLEPIDPGPVSSDQSYIRTRTMTAATGISEKKFKNMLIMTVWDVRFRRFSRELPLWRMIS